MENVEHHQHAATRLSLSPPRPPSRSATLSPESAAAEALANARWTPTKGQIGVLEELYQQGLRTPSGEQIQQVTARLREHGPIEGKNVFYWFQNHKARQRQRQKQQTFDYFSKQFHRPQPLPMLHGAPGRPIHRATPLPFQVPRQHPACNGEGMYMQQQQGYVTTEQAVAHAVYFTQQQQQQQLKQQQQQPQGYVPSHYPRDNLTAQQTPSGAMYYQYQAPTNAGAQQQPRDMHYPPATGRYAAAGARPAKARTLNLFPLHPTFAQREKKTQRPGTAGSTVPSASASYSWESEISESHNDNTTVPYFDFFGLESGGI